MSINRLIALAGIVTTVMGTPPRRDLPTARPNPNLDRAGRLDNGVLTVVLEAKQTQWIAVGSHQRPLHIAAFSETGKAPLLPGPLIRAPQGTELRLSLRNSLPVPLTFLLPAAIHGGTNFDAMDSLVVAPGAVRQMTTRASVPGNYIYRAIAPDQASQLAEMTGALAGAVVIDTAGVDARMRDRVLVIMALPDTQWVDEVNSLGRKPTAADLAEVRRGNGGRFTYTINGRSWPNTERIHATAGDTLYWRVINASAQVHAMHLHGFYFRVDALAGGLSALVPRPGLGQLVVTQLMAPRSSMSMTWSPDRPGNWFFHCHIALHLTSDPFLDAPNDRQEGGTAGMQDMSGMALGVVVAERAGAHTAAARAPLRRLRLIAEAGQALAVNGGRDTLRPMHFVLEEQGRRVEGTPQMSPELDLTRDEPVSITIVNHLSEPTSVHWHGIEVEDSYVDGVPGFSGAGNHLAPSIAPGDSFTVQFTPPRSGTFMYHAHVDEQREQLAGLEGALVVRDSGAAPSTDDHSFFLKGAINDPAFPDEINGQTNPDTVILHVGRPARVRLINLSTFNMAPIFSLTARPDSAFTLAHDTMVVEWRPLAKDGFDLPSALERVRPARQIVGIGETYDFDYRPAKPGHLLLEVRTRGAGTPLIIRVPIRVE
jgi:FtsP/CotA-like multicopper oxidase with cupredoxin domain